MRIDALAAAGKLLVEPSFDKDHRSTPSIPTNFAAAKPMITGTETCNTIRAGRGPRRRGEGVRMRLSTRFTTAIIAHVVLTVAVFTALNYRVFEVAGMPGAAERFAALNKGVADELQAATASLRPDVRALRTAPAVEGIVRAGEHGGVDPTEGVTVESWRTQL